MTLTTLQVRGAFIRDQRGSGFYNGEQGVAFDAWLEEHDAKVWEAGRMAGVTDAYEFQVTDNPHAVAERTDSGN